MVRPFLRLCAAAASLPLGYIACVAVIAATGGPDWPSAAVAFGLLVLCDLGVAVARTAAAPWRPMRLCLGWATLITGYLLVGLPMSPQGAERVSAVVLLALLAGGGVAALGVTRWPRVAAVLLALGGAWGVMLAVRFVTVLATQAGAPPEPSVVFSATFAGSVGAAWLAACWHGRAVLRTLAPSSSVLGTT